MTTSTTSRRARIKSVSVPPTAAVLQLWILDPAAEVELLETARLELAGRGAKLGRGLRWELVGGPAHLDKGLLAGGDEGDGLALRADGLRVVEPTRHAVPAFGTAQTPLRRPA